MENIWLQHPHAVVEHVGKAQALPLLHRQRSDKLYFSGLSAGYFFLTEYVLHSSVAEKLQPLYISHQWSTTAGALAYVTFVCGQLNNQSLMKVIGVSQTHWLLERLALLDLDNRIGKHNPADLANTPASCASWMEIQA